MSRELIRPALVGTRGSLRSGWVRGGGCTARRRNFLVWAGRLHYRRRDAGATNRFDGEKWKALRLDRQRFACHLRAAGAIY
jgi:hypothetical protein